MNNSKDPSEYFESGKAKFASGDYQGAIKSLTQVIHLEPNNHEAYFKLALIKSKLFGYDEKDYLKESGLLESNIPFRGLPETKWKEYEQSKDGFDKAIKIKPNFIKSYFHRAILRKKVHEYEEAIDDFSKVIELNPNCSDAYFYRGECKNELFDWESNEYEEHEANTKSIEEMKSWGNPLDDCNQAIEMNPISVEYLFRRGYLKIQHMFDDKSALKDFTMAIEIEPNYPFFYLWLWRGIAKSNLGDHQGAISDYSKAIELSSTKNIKAKIYKFRGSEKEKSDDIKGACYDWREANQLGNKRSARLIEKYCTNI